MASWFYVTFGKQHTQDLIQEFMDVVQNIDEITECYNTSGDYDFLIKVYAHDMKRYQQFMLNTLGKIDCIGSLIVSLSSTRQRTLMGFL